MEFLAGGDLMNLLIEKDVFTEQESVFYMAECILAVEAVHKLKYIHRDLKPDNILIGKDGHIKLTDFGLCKLYDTRPSDIFLEDLAARSSQIEGDEKKHKRNEPRDRKVI
jgi:serine/threonine kinase 38